MVAFDKVETFMSNSRSLYYSIKKADSLRKEFIKSKVFKKIVNGGYFDVRKNEILYDDELYDSLYSIYEGSNGKIHNLFFASKDIHDENEKKASELFGDKEYSSFILPYLVFISEITKDDKGDNFAKGEISTSEYVSMLILIKKHLRYIKSVFLVHKSQRKRTGSIYKNILFKDRLEIIPSFMNKFVNRNTYSIGNSMLVLVNGP